MRDTIWSLQSKTKWNWPQTYPGQTWSRNSSSWNFGLLHFPQKISVCFSFVLFILTYVNTDNRGWSSKFVSFEEWSLWMTMKLWNHMKRLGCRIQIGDLGTGTSLQILVSDWNMITTAGYQTHRGKVNVKVWGSLKEGGLTCRGGVRDQWSYTL